MKKTMVLQFEGNDYSLLELERRVKEQWKEEGKRVKDIQKLDLYVKPEEGVFYYVVNELESGSLPLE